ncbi:alpha/beta hydrolase domain-containing protein [Ligilactobacillus acidipiscis]|uniref:alpha/beta hydrolase domain-containing protein n=1 Tax=Ligilactobacillus acidipiscis TaxID=89059 RepID=UPI0023F6F33D|nr:alpha/beta hydrolase domain-containing protein [Ligilactobacillus acidipiscis]WEV57442.1 alpha/beta hydrolase domain-containing protein [Ligilactobacillus acidipiscis]
MTEIKITEPKNTGHYGRPFAAYFGDIGALGYEEHEYFIEGQAQHVTPTSELTMDGKWTIRKNDPALYKTRILVQLPQDKAKFNGTVLVEWANNTFGFDDAINYHSDVYAAGFGIVLVTAQSVGVHGLNRDPHGLNAWDPERYKSLNIPDENLAYDIFTQVGQLLSVEHSQDEADPMRGLKVQRKIALGYSQSGTHLCGYVNAIQPVENVYDGIMLLVGGGFASGFSKLQFPDEPGKKPIPCLVRDDLKIPVFAINSELEAMMMQKFRRPDDDKYRSWEVTGAAHLSRQGAYLSRDRARLNSVESPILEILLGSSQFMDSEWLDLLAPALIAFNNWIDGISVPASFAPLEVDEQGQFKRDENGNALGGVRLPFVEAPLAAYNGTAAGYGGIETPFTKEKLVELYADQEGYLKKITQVSQEAVKNGLITSQQMQQYIKAAHLTLKFR